MPIYFKGATISKPSPGAVRILVDTDPRRGVFGLGRIHMGSEIPTEKRLTALVGKGLETYSLGPERDTALEDLKRIIDEANLESSEKQELKEAMDRSVAKHGGPGVSSAQADGELPQSVTFEYLA